MSTIKVLVNEARHNLKVARTDAGFTQAELAKRIGRNRLWVNFRENGERNFYLDDLIKWAKATGKPVLCFFKPSNLSMDELGIFTTIENMKNSIEEVEKYCITMITNSYE